MYVNINNSCDLAHYYVFPFVLCFEHSETCITLSLTAESYTQILQLVKVTYSGIHSLGYLLTNVLKKCEDYCKLSS